MLKQISGITLLGPDCAIVDCNILEMRWHFMLDCLKVDNTY